VQASPATEQPSFDDMKDLPMNEQLEFTYNLGKEFKIDPEEAKKRRA
jgi:hypothetical protein